MAGDMGMPVKENIARGERRGILFPEKMSVRGENRAARRKKQRVIGHNGKFENHLVYFAVAVAADAEELFFRGLSIANTSLGA